MKNSKKLMGLYIILNVLFSCTKDKKVLRTIGTRIDSTKMIHWGKGFYKTRIYYNFTYSGKNYKCSYKSNKLTRSHDYIYSKGDSILISFPISNPKDSKVLKKIFD
ncbi:hypothetical protein [Polaribacter cellanae]|uniref:Uncharacterized protein n=1 Tax=Polaribacter cellanae TaxID=2818493 RepID=A0A975CJX8_9FLAO|nr:hypothetical protein [Polaribacter cellanae]QTE21053.1 hypothetical protein J3359_09345 [Polaribacter cellanae]